MSMTDLQNLVGRTFETQAIYQQVLSQADQALRQKERRLAEERLEEQDLVAGPSHSAAADPLDLDLNRREAHAGDERDKRYRPSLKLGGVQGAQPESGAAPGPGSRIDLRV